MTNPLVTAMLSRPLSIGPGIVSRYFWSCPQCGTRLELRKRVTITKRRCPHCNALVTPQEIDRQSAESARHAQEAMEGAMDGCLKVAAVALVYVAAFVALLALISFVVMASR